MSRHGPLAERDRRRLKKLIVERRNALGYSQEGLAEAAGVTKSYINKIENENRMPGYGITLALARVLGLTPEELFPLDDAGNDER